MAGHGRGCEQEWLEYQYQFPKWGGVCLAWVWPCVSFGVFPQWWGGFQNPVDGVVIRYKVFFSQRMLEFVPNCSANGWRGDVESVEELDGFFPVGFDGVVGVAVRV